MTENEALEIAKRVATERGWPWREPVSVTKKRRWFRFSGWIVYSNAGFRGGNVRIEIDIATGEVIRAAYLPR